VSRGFDYTAPAELFAPKGRPGMRQPVAYRRFPSAAAAIRYAVEELSQAGLAAAILEVNEDRFDHIGIRQLYNDDAYPLRRRSKAD
jgi:Arc/MetJ-type ribon-helix-helix transcriptional regulator